jgi:hypothetical protein
MKNQDLDLKMRAEGESVLRSVAVVECTACRRLRRDMAGKLSEEPGGLRMVAKAYAYNERSQIGRIWCIMLAFPLFGYRLLELASLRRDGGNWFGIGS